MRYYVTVQGRTFEVDVAGSAVTVDGRPVDCDLRSTGGTLHHALVDGASHSLSARSEGTGCWTIRLDGHRLTVDVVDERTHAIRRLMPAAHRGSGPRAVRAPMPGLVVRVEVAPGDEVSAGQGVVVIEAMKMENELKADAPGIVSRVRARAGQPVEKGAILIEFEAAP